MAYSENVVAVVALALTLSLSQDPRIQQIIGTPTGNNGYEEYCQAASILTRKENRVLETYVRIRETGSTETVERPPSIPEGTTLPQLYRIQLKSLEPVFALIRAGNAKPVRYPQSKITMATLFPELVEFKKTGRLFQRAAYVAFSEGDSTRGTQAILDGLTFGKKVAVSGPIGVFVSAAIEQILFASVQRHLRAFSLTDAAKLASWAESALQAPNAMIPALESERRGLRDSIEDFLANPQQFFKDLGLRDDDIPESAKTMKPVEPARREGLYRRWFKRLELPCDAAIARLKEPERKWLDPIEVDDPEDDSSITADFKEHEVAGVMVVLQVMNALGSGETTTATMVSATARFRIQERLLRLYAGVLQFRWHYDRLPTNLAEVFGEEPKDAATGQSYIFEPHQTGDFRIVCQTKLFGDIDLVYKAATAGPDEGPVPPR